MAFISNQIEESFVSLQLKLLGITNKSVMLNINSDMDPIKKKKIEDQIESEQKTISYDMKEFTIELYVNKYLDKIDEDDNELYVPDYQREFIWDDKHQSRFIESLYLGLPVPFMFSAEIKESGRLEIVDGSQRIRTLAAFMKDELTLSHLEKLTEMNGCKYSELPVGLQRTFKNIAIRMVVLSSKATEEVRNEMFDRINTSSVPLLPMETRRGIYRGLYTDFIAELAKEPRFVRLCPMAKYMQNRREEEELILRLFAFYELYPNYSVVESKGVSKYLDNYLAEKNKSFNKDEKAVLKKRFYSLIDFMEKVYQGQGFAKKKGAIGISKPYFEAIAVGISLALKENPNLKAEQKKSLEINKNNRNDFYRLIDGRYKTHTATKIKNRIEYVKRIYEE